MGTPDFAVPTLNLLSQSHHHVTLVVTQPDRPKGRGRQPVPTPVKHAALRWGHDIIQPDSLHTDGFIDLVKQHKPDLFVLIAFGRILTGRLLSIPILGAINVHGSLLPKYRGAAPIQWAIINGEKETGITTILMDRGMDTGDILLSARTAIEDNDSAATLHDRLADIGAKLLMETVALFENNRVQPRPQDHTLATYAPMLNKSHGHIDWGLGAVNIERFIRGMSPWPGTFTFHDAKRLKIFSAHTIPSDTDEPPGTVLAAFPDELRVSTGKDALSILEIQGASGKRLLIKDFLRGYRLPAGTLLQ